MAPDCRLINFYFISKLIQVLRCWEHKFSAHRIYMNACAAGCEEELMCLWAHNYLLYLWWRATLLSRRALCSARCVCSDTQWAIPHKRHYQDALIPPYSYSHIHTHIPYVYNVARTCRERCFMADRLVCGVCADLFCAWKVTKEMLQLPWPINSLRETFFSGSYIF